jgi:hypothetical protein
MKTAVEFLRERYYQMNGKLSDEDFKKAEEMHERQIIDAHIDWSRFCSNLPTRSAVQYYYETFKQEQ